MKKYLALLMTLALLAGLFAGCSAKAEMSGGIYENGASFDGMYDAPAEAPEYAVDNKVTNTSGTAVPQDRKLIRTVYLEAETEDLDAILAQLEAQISTLGGYVEARHVYNGSRNEVRSYRYADLTIRIPANGADGFIERIGENANITSSKETTDDVTLTYVATESRRTALETEQTRLLELLAMAENMEDLLMIESRLTDVRAELEEITSQLRLYDNLVDYATIHLELQQVTEYTVAEPTLVERITGGFMDSLKGLGNGLLDFLVFVIVASPYLVFLGGIAVVIVILASRRRKKVRAKKAQAAAEAEKPTE